MDPVDVHRVLQERYRIQRKGHCELVSRVQYRHSEWTGPEWWNLWAFRWRHHKEGDATMDASYLEVCRCSHRWSWNPRMARTYQGGTASLDRSVQRCTDTLPIVYRRRAWGVHYTTWHTLRRNLSGDRAGTPAFENNVWCIVQRRWDRSLHSTGYSEERTRPPGCDQRKDRGEAWRHYCTESYQRGIITCLCRRLCAWRLWNRSHHGSAGAWWAGLRFCDQVRTSDRAGHQRPGYVAILSWGRTGEFRVT